MTDVEDLVGNTLWVFDEIDRNLPSSRFYISNQVVPESESEEIIQFPNSVSHFHSMASAYWNFVV
ncbi:hypothetical protein HanRHA438_Chr12g0576301 [Helianthus annuus]|uniref:Uncharacterized protein n=1 Tax=Helianthus annuus TaxID=4232 RepID=A0A251T947_HELAN|nr:hypothetical protein HanXRQr2_Chr12g0564941 [Helianthus annuus]KAJ0864633.1 hypothetical protein HanPSC8_Chr12g0544221 [Helianthus annuus]KAJ0868594.1 hypothetical protein HanRHA438_Chr12g0576301 [Helianthus annuus]